MAAVGGDIDLNLTIFDLSQNQILSDGVIDIPYVCKNISFNPFLKNSLCLSGDHGLYFYNISNHYNTTKFKEIESHPPIQGVNVLKHLKFRI